jgi:alpha 1,2-mannosyltransferase
MLCLAGVDVCPQVFNILEIPSHARPSVSHESGQMVLDKARHWKGLLLCM